MQRVLLTYQQNHETCLRINAVLALKKEGAILRYWTIEMIASTAKGQKLEQDRVVGWKGKRRALLKERY